MKDKVTGKPVYDFLLSWQVYGTDSSLPGGGGFSNQ